MTRKTGIVVSGILLSVLLACQPAPLPGAPATTPSQQRVVNVGAPQGAAITVGVGAVAGMGIQALPMTAADVNHYDIQLFKQSDNTQVGGTLTLSAPNTTGQFVGVPDGVYYMKANAYQDALGTVSIVQGGAFVQSVNNVTVASGVATYDNPTSIVPAPTSLVVNLPLLDGTVGTGLASVTVTGRGLALPGADRTGLSLFNRASRRALPNPVNPSVTFNLTQVQTGAMSGQTHEIWGFAAIFATSQASVPRPYGAGSNATGIIPTSISVTMAAQTLETAGGAGATPITVAPGFAMTADASNNIYYYDGTNIRTRQFSATYADAIALTCDTGALTGWVITPSSAGFYSTGTNILKGAGPSASQGVLAVSATNVGRMCVDEADCLYYIDTSTGKIMRCVWTGTAYQAPVIAVTPGATPTMLFADSYGSVYYSNGTNIFKAQLGLDETTYQPPVQVVTAAGITSFGVDRGGNIYFTDGGNSLKMVGAGEATIYTIAGPGTGAGTDLLAGVIPTGTNLNTTANVTPCVSGRLFFTSAGVTNRFLRYI